MSSERIKAIKKLDRIFSQWVRQSAAVDGQCQCYTCGKWKPLTLTDAGHYISRSNHAVRFDLRNVKPQCRSCNRFQHGQPVDFREGLVREYGEAAVLELEAARHEVKKLELDELEAAIEDFTNRLKELA